MYVLILRRGTAASWTAKNPVLRSGEPGYELDTGRLKIGNGTSKWTELGYFSPTSTSDAPPPTPPPFPPGTGIEDGLETELQDHIASESPHPVYDDGPSLALLYENAKV